jgi:dTDP-4-dehydrorhamnose 3,5-epimerase
VSPPFTELPEPLPGVRRLEPRLFRDDRGAFVKTYHQEDFAALGLDLSMREEYYSVSHRGVLRGMHFQVPPENHAKLVYCVSGRVLDVVLDLRRSSPTFGRSAGLELSAQNRHLLQIPTGVAHGFLALEADSILVYKTTTVHSPAHDAGIRWDSFGFAWGMTAPIISPRDAGFPALHEFVSPFA